ncbi:hypothetical protein EVAR_96371_1 [Eumeta japonica]|uniref:Uncharacterized protein n=1 Tax=Eumeta variegata TaxID=151549 RepID=A0A4C1SZJ5_EUMVA|nr:hypothetical protein EVAR_96371_1 [Eumeta japonica]
MDSESAQNQTTAILRTLDEWGLSRYVKAMCFDTTVNTDRVRGTVLRNFNVKAGTHLRAVTVPLQIVTKFYSEYVIADQLWFDARASRSEAKLVVFPANTKGSQYARGHLSDRSVECALLVTMYPCKNIDNGVD